MVAMKMILNDSNDLTNHLFSLFSDAHRLILNYVLVYLNRFKSLKISANPQQSQPGFRSEIATDRFDFWAVSFFWAGSISGGQIFFWQCRLAADRGGCRQGGMIEGVHWGLLHEVFSCVQ